MTRLMSYGRAIQSRWLLACIALGLLPAGVALAGARSSGGSCEAHSGRTQLETPSARVFSTRGAYYACLRPSGRVWRLLLGRSDPGRQITETFEGNVQVAGRYVAWRQKEVNPMDDFSMIALVDLRSGRYHQAGGASAGLDQHGPYEYVLNQDRTVVWSDRQGVEYRLQEDSTRGTRYLQHGVTEPQRSLALSLSGRVVYWTEAGHTYSANIP